MNDTMIGKCITELLMDDPAKIRKSRMPKLRRFTHYDKPICYVRELGAGEEGVVHLFIIEGKGYALKLVRSTGIAPLIILILMVC